MTDKAAFFPTPLIDIYKMVSKYKSTMQDIAKLQISSGQPNPTIVEDKQYLQFYIDKEAFLRIQNFFNEPDCECLGVFFGIDDSKNSKITASFLGLNSKKEIINAHFGKTLDADGNLVNRAELLGEENWPPPPLNLSMEVSGKRPFFTVNSDDTEIANYFGQ